MAEEKATKGINLPMLLGIIILVILMAAGTSFLMVYLFSRTGETIDVGTKQPKEEKVVVKPGPTFELGLFIANIAGSKNSRYIKTNVTIEVDKEEGLLEATERKAQLRDALNTILRSQTLADVEDPSLKGLKTQIVNKLNTILTKGKVKDVWFTDFQIQ